MSERTEHQRRQEASKIILGPLKQWLKLVKDIPSQVTPVGRGKVDFFRDAVRYAVAAEVLQYQCNGWRKAIDARRKFLKERAHGSGDIVDAIEVDEEYANYLLEIGQVNEAAAVIKVMAGEYSLADLGHDEISIIYVHLAAKLVDKKELEQAAELIKHIDLTKYGNEYFSALLDYYEDKNDFEGAQHLDDELEARAAIWNGTDSFPLAWTLNKSKETLMGFLLVRGKIREAFELIDSIQDQGYQHTARRVALKSLFELGDFNPGQELAGEYLQRLMERLDGTNIEQSDELIGDILRLLRIFAEYADESERLLGLSIASLFGESLEDFSEGQVPMDSVVGCLLNLKPDDQTKHWQAIIEILSVMNLKHLCTFVFKIARSRCPEDADELKYTYAGSVYSFGDEGLQMSLKYIKTLTSSPHLQLSAFEQFALRRVKDHGFAGWAESAGAMFGVEAKMNKSLGKPLQSGIQARRTAQFIEQVAVLALHRNEWDIFVKLLQSQYLDLEHRAHILVDVSRWLVDGEPF